jgi:hypothetical protein
MEVPINAAPARAMASLDEPTSTPPQQRTLLVAAQFRFQTKQVKLRTDI